MGPRSCTNGQPTVLLAARTPHVYNQLLLCRGSRRPQLRMHQTPVRRELAVGPTDLSLKALPSPNRPSTSSQSLGQWGFGRRDNQSSALVTQHAQPLLSQSCPINNRRANCKPPPGGQSEQPRFSCRPAPEHRILQHRN